MNISGFGQDLLPHKGSIVEQAGYVNFTDLQGGFSTALADQAVALGMRLLFGPPKSGDANAINAIKPYTNSILAFFMMDEPDCAAGGDTNKLNGFLANIEVQIGQVHTSFPGAKTMITLGCSFRSTSRLNGTYGAASAWSWTMRGCGLFADTVFSRTGTVPGPVEPGNLGGAQSAKRSDGEVGNHGLAVAPLAALLDGGKARVEQLAEFNRIKDLDFTTVIVGQFNGVHFVVVFGQVAAFDGEPEQGVDECLLNMVEEGGVETSQLFVILRDHADSFENLRTPFSDICTTTHVHEDILSRPVPSIRRRRGNE